MDYNNSDMERRLLQPSQIFYDLNQFINIIMKLNSHKINYTRNNLLYITQPDTMPQAKPS